MKDIMRVWDAIVREHCNTSEDVADVTGLPVASCSTHVSELIAAGMLRRNGRTIKRHTHGRYFQCFEPTR